MLITFEQLWQSLKDTALMVFQPVLEKISDFANSDIFKNFAALAECAIFTVSNAVLVIFDLISNVGDFLYDNWSWISPIIYGAAAALIVYNAVMGIAWLTTLKDLAAKAAHAVASAAQTAALIALTAAQDGLNVAIRACPVTWIVIGIIAIITAIIVLVRYFDIFGAKSTSIFGTICGLVHIVLLLFWNLLLTVVNVFLGIVRAAYVCGENLYIVFHNAISGIKGFFFDLLSTALNVIAHICSALNWLPFIDFDFSGIVGKADEFAEKAAEAKADKLEYKSIMDAFREGFHTFDAFSSGWAKDAFQSGASFGDGIVNRFKSSFEKPVFSSDFAANLLDGIYSNTGDTAANTAAAVDALDYTEEDLAYLKDIAEREAINRYTTAEITVNQENTNYVDKDIDLDGVMDFWANSFAEKLEISGEGVHP